MARKWLLAVASLAVLLAGPCVPSHATAFTNLGTTMDLPSATGAAWGDYDKDGYADLFISGVWQTHRCALYHNDGDGTFTDVTSAMGFPTTYPYTEDWGCAWGDYDNDGDLDLVVAGGNHNIFLYRNDVSSFTEVGEAAGFVYYPTARGVAWGDYDGDNWLDLYVAYEWSDLSRLFHNNGDGTFTEVESNGMEFSPAGVARVPTWADYDSDGFLDLLVGRKYSEATEQNVARLYRNAGEGDFVDYAPTAGLQEVTAAAGVTWGDYDNDGNLDVYIAADHPRPAWLLHNNRYGAFDNLNAAAGMGAWEYEACGASWADYDNDGLLDLATAPAMGLRPLLWHNNGDGTFTDRAPLDGMTDVRDFQANCWADYDLDGLMDLLVGAADDYSCLYHNNGPAASYLRIRVLTDSDGDATDENTDEDRDAIGARVEVNLDNDTSFPPGRTLLRLVDGGSSWMGQNEPVAQFGLGTGPTLVALRVGFPDGSIVAMDSVGVNQEVVISDIAQTFGSLSGTVTDALTDLPIENARAVCSYLTAASDSSGDYLIPRIPAGTGYTMRARAYGYCEAARSDVAVGEETTTVEDFGLLPAPDNIGLYAAAAGTFYLRNSNSTGGANVTFRFGPAPSTWAAFSGDWDADLDETVGMYEQATSTWRLRNSNTPGVSDLKFRFGPAPCAWKPITGDWDGDGVDTVGLYDPATGTFRLRNSNTAGVSDVKFRFGPAPCSWLPIAGDWNGDGIDTVGLYDPATGTFRLININATAATADLKYRFGPAPCSWLPIAGDWDSDGTETVGLYDPATDTFRLINSNVTHSVADVKFVFGPISGTQQPIAGDWDGM